MLFSGTGGIGRHVGWYQLPPATTSMSINMDEFVFLYVQPFVVCFVVVSIVVVLVIMRCWYCPPYHNVESWLVV